MEMQTGVGKVKYLADLGHQPEEARRLLTLTWTQDLAETASDKEFGDIVQYFHSQGNMQAILGLTEVKLKSLAQPKKQTSRDKGS